uniref:Uncharacterized protein n=1 Tax=Staphylococcus aureus TaxID=1280 RepID=A0A499S3Y7_STAAU|nr:hypothetical protein D0Y80_l00170 [Staphylococcus aureus]
MLNKENFIGTPIPSLPEIVRGFFGAAMSPYLLRLFSQNVKIATIHPEITGAIILTKRIAIGSTSFHSNFAYGS